ncbi:MAG TPA: hypothetical protein PK274_06110 [Candidatus Fermentibacter daniensis]|nr:hypothetical protein [Candidatus Fermentibacter daniensis]
MTSFACLLAALAALAGTPPGVYSCEPPDTPPPPPLPEGSDRFPVLCYHSIDTGGELSVSARRFRNDLEQLESEGFFLITPEDLSNGLVRLPEGRSPVMITFDDGWQSQFNYLRRPDGSLEIDPRCAVGILEEFCDSHPDFGRGAVFFISFDKIPFGQQEYIEQKFNFLLDRGYCIGNHSARHRSFMGMGADSWGPALTGAQEAVKKYVGIRLGGMYAAAWPGGMIPEGARVDERLSTISFEGIPSAGLGFVVDGALADLGSLRSASGRLRISRMDMALSSVTRLLGHRGFYRPETWREDLHSPMPFSAVPLD